ncbi:MAG: formate dehydrogenase subunit alpha [Methanothrix sp.]|jgi:formate dehydrogenase alpha subunit|uniref:formate dehydrogenase subunit alpha n=1 Tax=Methanothrix sp. TaxID=90426 RepID=UPI00247D52BE|nr:formate dehydrogenase subunit alpha [Methanothrix sp.]
MALDAIETTCVYCGCGCGLYLHVEDNRIIAVTPSMKPPASGRLCAKGWLLHGFVNHPERLREPLIRRGDRHVPTSWSEALSFIARSFDEIKRDSGPDALAVLTSAKATNEENYLLMKLCRAALGSNNIDNVARLCHAPTLFALGSSLGSGSMTNPIESLLHSDVIMIIGSNTTEQHPAVALHVMEARRKGARIIVVDPRITQMAEIADLHLQLRPGTDIALLNAILNIVIQEGMIDEEFIRSRTEGFDDIRDHLAEYSPEVAERICGVPAELIHDAAVMYGGAEAAAIVYAMGITQHAYGTDNVQAIVNLALATGNLGRDGSGIYPLRGHQNVQGACDMGALPDYYTGYQRVSEFREKFEDAWKVELPASRGRTAIEIMSSAGSEIRGLYISGENPALSYPDSSRIRGALESLDLLVVSDIFPTETTRMADVILPVASFAEKYGTVTSTERRVQLIRKAIDPPGSALPEWVVAARLLEIFGVSSDYNSPADVMKEIAALTPSYGGISHERLERGGIHWPCPTQEHRGTPVLYRDGFPRGRAVFRHVDQRSLDDERFTLIIGRSQYHFHTGSMTRRVCILEREVPEAFVDMNPKDAAALGIRNGTGLILESESGTIRARARLSDNVREGVLFMPFHFRESPVNLLTKWQLDQFSKIPALKIVSVRVRREDA